MGWVKQQLGVFVVTFPPTLTLPRQGEGIDLSVYLRVTWYYVRWRFLIFSITLAVLGKRVSENKPFLFSEYRVVLSRCLPSGEKACDLKLRHF